jgi:NAD(P)-dependent dehydrogenase (short-subunit alcohol dehydrogenase family)
MTPGPLVCAITGGTRGIGAHVAEMLATDGWSVAVCSRHEEDAVATAMALSRVAGCASMGMGADVASPREMARFAKVVGAELGPVRAVVANAAELGPVGPLHTTDLTRWASAISVNLVGVANTIAAFGPVMVERRIGSVVTLCGGGVGGPSVAACLSAYTSSKAAVAMLTETVARELSAYNVRVNAISPGAVATKFIDEVIEAGPEIIGSDLYEQVVMQRSRPIDLDSFGRLLRFLLDDGAPFVTGRVLSARWDSPDDLSQRPPDARSSRYRLRRIDGDLYFETEARTE